MVLWQMVLSHVWLGSIRPRSQCVGGMLPVQWCYKHVLELSQQFTSRRRSRSTCLRASPFFSWLELQPDHGTSYPQLAHCGICHWGRGVKAGEGPRGPGSRDLGVFSSHESRCLDWSSGGSHHAREESRGDGSQPESRLYKFMRSTLLNLVQLHETT